MVNILTSMTVNLIRLTVLQPTVTLSAARLRTLRAARDVDHVTSPPNGKQAEGGSHALTSSSNSSGQATTLRQETLGEFLQEISPLPRYRVAMLWLSLLIGLLLSTKDVRYAISDRALPSPQETIAYHGPQVTTLTMYAMTAV
jgi:hypothetical protein